MKESTLKALVSASFEVLENRQMMSVSPAPAIALSSGTLILTGDAQAATRFTVDYGTNAASLGVNVGNSWETVSTSAVKQIQITGGNGNDMVFVNPNLKIPVSVKLGDGNDTVRTAAGNDTIVVGNGNDLIYGKGGNNSITTGNGNDTLLGDTGNDTLTAGNGNDEVIAGGGTNQIVVGAGSDFVEVSDKVDHVTVSGHDINLNGLKNGYLYTKGGVATNASEVASGTTTAGTGTGSTGTGTTGTGTSSGAGTSTGTGTSSGTGTGTGTGAGTGTPTAPTTPANPDNPVPVINALAGTRQAGLVLNVDGLGTKLTVGTAIEAQYSWNFGDTGGVSNTLEGFNSAHVYDNPGTYTVTLTVTNAAGLTSTATQTITIAASTRRSIYVDPSTGNDGNAGTEAAPLKSLAAAFNDMTDNTQVYLAAGQTYDVTASLQINHQNVVVTRYGTGADPHLVRIKGNGVSTINVNSGTNGLTIEHLQFDSQFAVAANQQAPKNGVSGIYLGGTNLAIRDCTFLNVDDAMNELGNPTGVLIQHNSAPLITGVRGYFVWGQGLEQVIDSNTAANSTREHILRLVSLTEIAVVNNVFTNADRTAVDPYDYSKGCIEVHRGSYEWITGNNVTGGDIRVGPLGLWGESPSSSTENAVIEDNQLTGTFIFVKPGTHHVMISGNVINNVNGQAIIVDGEDSSGRISTDITIENNTAVNTGTSGNFLMVNGYATDITLKNNLWVAPSVVMGVNATSPVYVDYANLSLFGSISGNVWPAESQNRWEPGGMNFVGTSWVASGYQTIAQWDAEPMVHNDTFENVTLGGSYQMKIGSDLVGAPMKIAA